MSAVREVTSGLGSLGVEYLWDILLPRVLDMV